MTKYLEDYNYLSIFAEMYIKLIVGGWGNINIHCGSFLADFQANMNIEGNKSVSFSPWVVMGDKQPMIQISNVPGVRKLQCSGNSERVLHYT